jgi:ComF family protein
MKIHSLTTHLISPVLDFLYPPTCLVCNKLMPDGHQKICANCWNAIPRVTHDLPLYQQTREKLLGQGNIADLVSCFIFEKEGPFQHIAHALKYREYKSVGVELGMRLAEVVREWGMEFDVLIPVPLHRIKRRERGYNQSEFIALGIASLLHKPVIPNAVRRTRDTQTQTKLNIEERRRNMEFAFDLIPSSSQILSKKICLLVDDIITTGATTNACAQAILSAGATKIIAASTALAE